MTIEIEGHILESMDPRTGVMTFLPKVGTMLEYMNHGRLGGPLRNFGIARMELHPAGMRYRFWHPGAPEAWHKLGENNG